MSVFITGDTHGQVLERLKNIPLAAGDIVIILGDAGINFYLNNTDYKNKVAIHKYLCEHDATLYLIRGNHEERPENLGYMHFLDSKVEGEVYIQTTFPRIRYFMDGEVYNIDGRKTLVIGGAYSVDKYYRLAGRPENTDQWTGWFRDEQLSSLERAAIFNKVRGDSFDLVLTHTCPIDWQPKHLFLSSINQSQVDATMENFLQDVAENISFGVWIFGHYHSNLLIRPHVEMLFENIETLDDITARWDNYDLNGTLDYWLQKDPMFYAL